MFIEYEVKANSRQWGYGWTNQPARTYGDEYPHLDRITHTDTTGTLRQCQDEEAAARHLHTGGEWWYGVYFYKSHLIVTVWDGVVDYNDGGDAIGWREAWVDIPPTDRIANGWPIRVRVKISDDDLLDAEDVGAYLQVTARRIRALAETYGIGRKVGRDWVFTVTQAKALDESRRASGRPPK